MTIEVKENFNTFITCEKAKFNIVGKSGEDFSYLPEIEKNDSLPNPSSIFYYFQTTKISDVWKEVLNEK